MQRPVEGKRKKKKEKKKEKNVEAAGRSLQFADRTSFHFVVRPLRDSRPLRLFRAISHDEQRTGREYKNLIWIASPL